MDEITESVSKNIVLPYQVRQSLSAFLGQPLDSSLNMGSIMANQAAYAPPAPQQPQGKVSKSGASKLTIADRTAPQRRPEA